MAGIPPNAKTGFWTAIGVLAAFVVWKMIEGKLS